MIDFDLPEPERPAPVVEAPAAPPAHRTEAEGAHAGRTLPWNLIDLQGNKMGEIRTKRDIARLFAILKRVTSNDRGCSP